MKRALLAVAPSALVLAALGAWEGACRGLGINPLILPPPSAIAAALIANLPLLLVSAWNTFQMALMALAVASVAANALALAAAISGVFERSIRPLTIAVQVTPVVALAPLIQIWAGIDHPRVAEIALAALVAFFPIYSGALSGLRSADPD
ncbi:MAG TPA: ABC transporter permease, partial [Caulobacterales bacterium]|nr:ABC transporter permease [Caulobacterales bacterium]